VDGHRFDANPHPDPTFHFDADPDPNSDPTPSFTYVGKSGNFLYIFLQQCQSTLLYLSRQRPRCHNSLYFGQFIAIFWKKYTEV
jgi:hypothetical protein